jgi:hypothetical protein
VHRSQELMDELRRAKAEVVKLNTEIAKITQELEKFPPLSDRVAVDITEEDAVIFLTAGSEFTLTRDELQVLVEMLGGSPKEGEEEGEEEPADLLFSWPDRVDDKEMATFVADKITDLAALHGDPGDWYYRVRRGTPLQTIFSDGKTWKFRQFLARKARNKMPQKLVIEVVSRAKSGKPCQHVLTRTLWFGGPESK